MSISPSSTPLRRKTTRSSERSSSRQKYSFVNDLGVAHQRAADSLQKRLTSAGKIGKKVEHHKVYLGNSKTWWKTWYNIERIPTRPEGNPVWGIGDVSTNRAGIANGHGAFNGYDVYGNSSTIAVPAAQLKAVEDCGRKVTEFCEEYRRKFRRLYREWACVGRLTLAGCRMAFERESLEMARSVEKLH
jgi:hypothetical protein